MLRRDQLVHRRFAAATGQLADLAPIAQHRDAVRHANHLAHLRRDEQHRHAGLRQPQDLVHDFLLGRHVDAARGFVEDQQARVGREPARDHRLLLVAAREQAHRHFDARAFDAQRRDELFGQGRLLGDRHEAPHTLARLQGERDVFAHRQVGHDAVGLAFFGAQRQAQRDGIGRVGQAHVLAVDVERAAIGRLQTEQQASQLGAAGTQQAGEAQHFARADRQVGGLKVAGLAEGHGLQQRGRGGVGRGGRRSTGGGREFAAQHRRDQGLRAEFARRPFTDPLPVAQHRDAVGHRIHLVQEVRDEENRHALAAQAAQHGEELLHFIVVKAGRGLVEDQHLALDTECTRNGHHLLYRHRAVRQQLRHIDVQPDARQQLAGALVHGSPVDAKTLQRAAARVAPGEHVLGHRQVGAEVHLLVDGADAELLCFER